MQVGALHGNSRYNNCCWSQQAQGHPATCSAPTATRYTSFQLQWINVILAHCCHSPFHSGSDQHHRHCYNRHFTVAAAAALLLVVLLFLIFLLSKLTQALTMLISMQEMTRSSLGTVRLIMRWRLNFGHERFHSHHFQFINHQTSSAKQDVRVPLNLMNWRFLAMYPAPPILFSCRSLFCLGFQPGFRTLCTNSFLKAKNFEQQNEENV